MKNKRYLTGLDWIIQGLNSATGRKTGTGNCSQIVLELNGTINETAFQDTAQRFAAAFPVLKGRVSRAWTLEPYWKIPRHSEGSFIRTEVHRMVGDASPDQVFQTLEKLVNTPFQSNREYVVLHLLHLSGNRCCVALTFDHRLLDARGAEQFLQLFSQFASGAITLEEIKGASVSEQPSLLNGWKDRFESGRTVMRSMREFSEFEAARLAPEDGCEAKGTFILHPLNREQSTAFIEKAYKEAGYLMFMPYTLGVATEIFDRLCQRKNKPGGYIIPCTIDLRGTDTSLRKMFFNYCSMFFFKVDQTEVSDRNGLVKNLKQQYFNQTKAELPQHFQNMMVLTRILPVRVFDWMMCRHMRHCFGSFSFASVGGSLFEQDKFWGIEIENLFHMPQIPPQTGIGFFFNQFHGRINIGISFREGLIDATDKAEILNMLAELH
ncbi:MAG: hypothetical protein K9M45_05645 [Kiritimatiellales bacterium]|nr:hypothetical protein [Kiritimatiellales bacterium]